MPDIFAPARLSGPWARRLHPRRAWIDELPWNDKLPQNHLAARWTWTQAAYSEYAAAASFAAITSALAQAQAPLDFLALSSDFVGDEIAHVEVSARIAAALGGGVQLEVDLNKLVHPPGDTNPGLRAAELIVRYCCVGEALTVPLLNLSRGLSDSPLVTCALKQILRDEVPHAQFGGWFLEWADTWLDDDARTHLGHVAGRAIHAFAPLLGNGNTKNNPSTVPEPTFPNTFVKSVKERVMEPLSKYGIVIPHTDLQSVGVME